MVFCLAGSKLNVIGEKMQNGAWIERRNSGDQFS